MKKLFALAVALMMVMALSVTVFADNIINEGDLVMNDSSWWTQLGNDEIGMFDDYSAVSKLVVTCEGHEINVGYNGADGEWHNQAGKEVTVDFADVLTDPESAYICIALSAGDGVDYDVHYVVYGKGGDSAAEPEAPAAEPEPEAPAAEPEAPAAEPAPAPAPSAPATGLALAVVPAVMALAAVAVSKKH